MAKGQTILYFFVLFMLIFAPHRVLEHKKSIVKQRNERERYTLFVAVRDNNVDQALRVLKKKMQREGLFREMKNRRAFEKPSERRARETAESTRRVRKLMRKRMEREGY
tara:strand:- start:8919 stop:9245 length:327 start_codon:yes stop_codon:yes gene_type:complete